MKLAQLWARDTVEAACSIDIEQTPESFHAHAAPEGVEVRPGDRVIIHDAPDRVAFGGRIACERRVTVTRARWLERRWTRLRSLVELTELYEVGFSERPHP